MPWYNYTPNYWRQVNRPYVRNIAEEPWRPRHYMYAAIPGAITAVSGAAFIAGRPVAQNLVRNVAERDIRNAPPARMGEVLPQFRAQPGRSMGQAVVSPNVITRPQGRRADPNPVVSMPQIIRERAPGGSAAAVNLFAPNANVVQPRVWQDPNPVVPRQQIQLQRPTPFVTQNPGLGEPAVPMPKDRGERPAPIVEPQRGQAPAEYRAPRQNVQSQHVIRPAPPTQVERRAPSGSQGSVPQRPAQPPVVEQRSVTPAAVQPAHVTEQRRIQEARPIAEPPQREKGRAPVQPQQQ